MPNFPVKRITEDYLHAFTRMLQQTDMDAIQRIAQRLQLARDRGATVYIAGNGGSAATASHWVNDLGKATKRSGRPPIRVMSLCDNVSWLTALGNDEGYERVFSGQLENFAQEGDVLIVIRRVETRQMWYRQREGEVIHLIAQRLTDFTPMLGSLDAKSRDFH